MYSSDEDDYENINFPTKKKYLRKKYQRKIPAKNTCEKYLRNIPAKYTCKKKYLRVE